MTVRKGDIMIADRIEDKEFRSLLIDDSHIRADRTWSASKINNELQSKINDKVKSDSTTYSANNCCNCLNDWISLNVADYLTMTSGFTLNAGSSSMLVNPITRQVLLKTQFTTANSYSASQEFVPYVVKTYIPLTASVTSGLYGYRYYTGSIIENGSLYIASYSSVPANNTITVSSIYFY